MTPGAPALLDTRVEADSDIPARNDHVVVRRAGVARTDIRLSIHEELAAIETEWRAFERVAECTVFQCHEWLATWQRHIGARRAVRPAIVVARDGDGEILFVLPLAVERFGLARRLTWLGSGLCDYNAPLLAADFSLRVSIARFQMVWADILFRLRSHPRFRYDLIDLQQMPETVGAQRNPMLRLGTVLQRDCAYLVSLTDKWETLYAKRSSATRRHDRSKRQRLAEHGAVRLVNAAEPHDVVYTLETLMTQKARWFAEMGVGNLFARPGYREFFLDIATNPRTRHLTHVSRLDVGASTVATNFGLKFGDCYYHVLASYDRESEIAKFGPGAAHLHDLMRYAIGLGYRKFDFSVGDERYKFEWCDDELKLFDFTSAESLLGTCTALPLTAARRLKRKIKQNPALWRAFRKARAFVGSLPGLRR